MLKVAEIITNSFPIYEKDIYEFWNWGLKDISMDFSVGSVFHLDSELILLA